MNVLSTAVIYWRAKFGVDCHRGMHEHRSQQSRSGHPRISLMLNANVIVIGEKFIYDSPHKVDKTPNSKSRSWKNNLKLIDEPSLGKLKILSKFSIPHKLWPHLDNLIHWKTYLSGDPRAFAFCELRPRPLSLLFEEFSSSISSLESDESSSLECSDIFLFRSRGFFSRVAIILKVFV